MKRIFLALGIIGLLASCNKETMQPAQYKYDYTFVGIQGHDDSARSRPFFCVPTDYVNGHKNDTFHIILYVPVDSLKFYTAPGTIYVDDANSKYIASGDPFNDRWYWLVTGYVGLKKIRI